MQKKNDFSELQSHHEKLYRQILEGEFLVDDQVDELFRVQELSMKTDNDETKFELHINPTMNCNFKCWYCYEKHIKDSKMGRKTISETEKFIRKIMKERPALEYFHLSWFGGEPLLYFDKVVLPILKSTKEIANKQNIRFDSGITTNGLLISDTVIENSRLNGLNFFQITLDGNRERHNKVRFISETKGSYDTIVTNIKKLARNQMEICLRINISKETLEGINNIAEDFKDISDEDRKNIRFDLHKVWQVGEDIESEIFEKRLYFKEMGFRVVSGTYNTVLNSCYGDHKNHALINYNGEVFKCTARDFTNANSEGILNSEGDIIWNEKFQTRLNSKFKNKPCLECSILPICGGGCTQQATEHSNIDYCVHDFDENKKIQLIKNRFIEIIADNG